MEWALKGIYLVLEEHIVGDLTQTCGGRERFPEQVTFDMKPRWVRINYIRGAGAWNSILGRRTSMFQSLKMRENLIQVQATEKSPVKVKWRKTGRAM